MERQPNRGAMADEPLQRWRPPRYALVAVAAAVGVLVGLIAALLRTSHAPAAAPGPLHAQVTWAAGAKRAPAFSLRDQRGRRVSLRSLHGRAVLVTFLDSQCKRECPVEGRALSDVLRRLNGTKAVTLVVSVDPWGDTRASAQSFAARARWHGDWHWLLGDRAALVPVWHAFNIAVKRVPGDVLHSVALYVIDPQGDLRAAYLFPFSADSVASDVRQLADTS
jgi:cytochrome oxidase Cu insertion factor (SCO1/SenC/PrrC family)